MILQIRSTDSVETEKLAEHLGRQLSGGEVIELRSDLGGGKTTFTRGLARGIGSADRVSSPTFTLSKIYKSKKLEIHHYDFYRLTDPGILADQLAESLGGDHIITVVEWANIVNGVLPEDRIKINFLPIANNPDERDIKFEYSQIHMNIMEELRQRE
jgi:tRNA threonylcarbamoyladenosine biosynthesis protein TsaE